MKHKTKSSNPEPKYCARCHQVKVTSRSFNLNFRALHGAIKAVRFCNFCTQDFAERYLLLTDDGKKHLKSIYAIWRKR
jgi:hypothetical protein